MANFVYPGNLRFNSRKPGIVKHDDLRWDDWPRESHTPIDAVQFAEEVASEYGVTIKY